jgi:hypothetical protein
MTQPHNRLANVVRKAIIDYSGTERRWESRESMAIGEERLSEQTRNQRPDSVFERCSQRRRRGREEAVPVGGDDMNSIELIEFSCPYVRISHAENTLERTYRPKHETYAKLADEPRELRGKEVRVTVIIVPSMGAVWRQSLKDLQKILKCE